MDLHKSAEIVGRSAWLMIHLGRGDFSGRGRDLVLETISCLFKEEMPKKGPSLTLESEDSINDKSAETPQVIDV